jgi:hypothetical protein
VSRPLRKERDDEAAKDVVNCGSDRDRVIADSEDILSDCERVRRH